MKNLRMGGQRQWKEKKTEKRGYDQSLAYMYLSHGPVGIIEIVGRMNGFFFGFLCVYSQHTSSLDFEK